MSLVIKSETCNFKSEITHSCFVRRQQAIIGCHHLIIHLIHDNCIIQLARLQELLSNTMVTWATLNKKYVLCRPGEANKNHPGSREIIFLPKIFLPSVIHGSFCVKCLKPFEI